MTYNVFSGTLNPTHTLCAELIEMSLGMWTWVGLRKHVLHGGAHWRHLANTIDLSMCGSNTAFLSITMTTR